MMIPYTDKPVVLIVDDVLENLIALEQVLQELDIKIIKAQSGNEALVATLYHNISLILLDIMMPEMNGYEVADFLKKDDKTADIPIVFITAMDKSDSQEIKGYSKGAVDYIYKPFNEFVLKSKVKVLLELFTMKKNIEAVMLKQRTEKPKILLVDDTPENLFAMEKLLKKQEAEIVKASSGNEALSQVLYHNFALIILDVQMPEMDGYEVAEILKSDDQTAGIPIVFVTAIDRDDSKEIKGYGRGAVDFIFKPFNEFILISKVKIFLDIYRMRTGLEGIVAEQTMELKHSNKQLREEVVKKDFAESELKKAKAYLSNVVDSISSALFGVNKYGRIELMNREGEALVGVSVDKAMGQFFNELLPWFPDLAGDFARSVEAMEPVERNHVKFPFESGMKVFNTAVFPLLEGKVSEAVIKIDDVTEQAKIEEVIIQSEKMMTVGGLAAGMAHEINNPLAGMIQNLQVLQNRLRSDLAKNREVAKACGISMEDIDAYMEDRGLNSIMLSVLESGRRATEIVENMLSFSRKGEARTKPCNLGELLDRTVDMAASDYNLKKKYDFKAVDIIREYDEAMPHVPCEGSKIQQVFLNLLKNGAEAMWEGMAAGNTTGRASFHLRLKSEGEMACIEVEDNGPGMEESVRRKIFEPFYTTKKQGKGTGLGLSISYFIITENHGGTLTVDSSPGKGAKFMIRLPLDSGE